MLLPVAIEKGRAGGRGGRWIKAEDGADEEGRCSCFCRGGRRSGGSKDEKVDALFEDDRWCRGGSEAATNNGGLSLQRVEIDHNERGTISRVTDGQGRLVEPCKSQRGPQRDKDFREVTHIGDLEHSETSKLARGLATRLTCAKRPSIDERVQRETTAQPPARVSHLPLTRSTARIETTYPSPLSTTNTLPPSSLPNLNPSTTCTSTIAPLPASLTRATTRNFSSSSSTSSSCCPSSSNPHSPPPSPSSSPAREAATETAVDSVSHNPIPTVILSFALTCWPFLVVFVVVGESMMDGAPPAEVVESVGDMGREVRSFPAAESKSNVGDEMDTVALAFRGRAAEEEEGVLLPWVPGWPTPTPPRDLLVAIEVFDARCERVGGGRAPEMRGGVERGGGEVEEGGGGGEEEGFGGEVGVGERRERRNESKEVWREEGEKALLAVLCCGGDGAPARPCAANAEFPFGGGGGGAKSHSVPSSVPTAILSSVLPCCLVLLSTSTPPSCTAADCSL